MFLKRGEIMAKVVYECTVCGGTKSKPVFCCKKKVVKKKK